MSTCRRSTPDLLKLLTALAEWFVELEESASQVSIDLHCTLVLIYTRERHLKITKIFYYKSEIST